MGDSAGMGGLGDCGEAGTIGNCADMWGLGD